MDSTLEHCDSFWLPWGSWATLHALARLPGSAPELQHFWSAAQFGPAIAELPPLPPLPAVPVSTPLPAVPPLPAVLLELPLVPHSALQLLLVQVPVCEPHVRHWLALGAIAQALTHALSLQLLHFDMHANMAAHVPPEKSPLVHLGPKQVA